MGLRFFRRRKPFPAGMSVARSDIERLAAADLMLVWPEARGWPQDIAVALATL